MNSGEMNSGECTHDETKLEYVEIRYFSGDQTIVEEKETPVCQKCKKMFHNEMMIWI